MSTLSVNLGNTEKRATKDRCTEDATLGFLTGEKKGPNLLMEERRAWLTGGPQGGPPRGMCKTPGKTQMRKEKHPSSQGSYVG